MTGGTWVRATWIGWLLGIPCVVVLALLGEMAGVGGAQALVGAGMGAGVGLMQARAVRSVTRRPRAWFAGTALGLAFPFLVADLVRASGRELPDATLWCVALGGLVVGVWQSRLLSAAGSAALWVALSVGGWFVAALAAAAADALLQSHRVAGLIGAFEYLGLIAAGGLALGLITAPAATRLREPTVATEISP